MLETLKVKPKGTPFKCPVCSGFGTVSNERIKCHGCKGRGWIVINNETGFPVEEEVKDDK